MITWRKPFGVSSPPHLIKNSRRFILGAMLVSLASGVPQSAMAQNAPSNTDSRAFAAPMIKHAQDMRRFKDHDNDKQSTPPVIPQFSRDPDASGIIASFQVNGKTFTTNNPFFQSLGTNDRTCFTCHQPQEGWTITPEGVQHRFAKTQGRDPIFRLFDGAVCPSADVSTLAAKRKTYSLVMRKGLIRVGLAIPANTEYEVMKVDDPYGCNTDPATGLQGALPTKQGFISVYRRPLPSTNIKFLSTVMWDGREPKPTNPQALRASLAQQFIDATLGHAQAAQAPTMEQALQAVDFELGLFTAQDFDNRAKSLTDSNTNAKGGPVNLSMTDFFVGINDPLGLNPQGTPFMSEIFTLYSPWLGSQNAGGGTGTGGDGGPILLSPTLQNVSFTDMSGDKDREGDDGHRRNDEHSSVSKFRQSVARGELVFNTKPINITGVAGINDALNVPSVPGFCGTCHDTPNVGNHSVAAPLHIGIASAADLNVPGSAPPPVLDISGLPVFTLHCVSGPLTGQDFVVTDPGRALITGKCADIGKFKGPILRGLAARAPYFHNGAAASLKDAVNFYNQRFNINFTEQEKTDLVNFLSVL